MPQEVFEVGGMDELAGFVDRFVSKYYLDAAEHAMTMTMLFLLDKLPKDYPAPPRPGSAAPHWTDKQRRWFFWALKAGKIQVPYRRTGTLGRTFTTEVRVEGAGVLGAIGTATPYAPWVVGPPQDEAIAIGGVQMFQAPIHQGRWWQFYAVVEKYLPEAYELLTVEMFDHLEKAYLAM